eukprot:CAMPEP_0182579218 /NCGR_PEP_ID=MMETSP1324-20130603/43601_1 /TAXON_ID=236786 /ORGANISM="Florenciella sp., Strain RCC1587" /LENGTH=144 /DNA_ID=CAMNT_0024795291 /DNA_START=277 /DNA_END=708 /DNA_ORIENTATION=-
MTSIRSVPSGTVVNELMKWARCAERSAVVVVVKPTFLRSSRGIVSVVRVVRRDALLLRAREHAENRDGEGSCRDLGLPAFTQQIKADITVRVDVRVAWRRLEEVDRGRLCGVLAWELDTELVLLALEERTLYTVQCDDPYVHIV